MNANRVLVTDFDGTMTNRDFYSLVVEQLLPPDMPDHWVDYRSGKITHFEALQKYFAAIRADESSVLNLLSQMVLDPHLKTSVASLQNSGWQIVVASAGCQWYIDKLLAEAGVSLEVHANPGRFEPGRGLLMELPTASPFFSPVHGIHKAGIVEHYLKTGATVAFAGDGFPDIDAAKLVTADLRFARRDLADVLKREGQAFQTYRVWSQIADQLIELSSL
ncbi:MAG: MtnX-like HAD-IB family phosphatase [Pirellulaceae bacterium]|nr:MtnX-like HAD-IB family phosphatase [Pirellulaceae bacterium]